MKSVYVFGPIFLSGESYLDFYKKIGALCDKYFEKVVATYPDFWNTKETQREFYDRTYEVITKLDLFIGEVTSPSWGVGMEFQMAQEHNIPCIAIAKEGAKQSSMIQGLPTLTRTIKYKDISDLITKLEPILQELTK